MQPVTNRHYCKHRGHGETGIVLIVMGAVFMAMKLDLIQMEWRWHIFAAIAFITMGLVEFLQFRRPHKIVEGLSKIVLGAWFYIAFSGLWDITPANSWPLVLIAVGTCMVLKSLFKIRSSNLSDRNNE